MKALTAAEMREVDRLTTERFGISGDRLMESAGKSVAEVFLEKYGERNGRTPGRVCVLCGKGNNGGDGFVAARHLKGNVGEVKVYLFGEPQDLRGDAAKNYQRWRELGETLAVIRGEEDWIRAWPDVAGSEVIVDALLGTGIRGGASGLLAQVIENVNRFSQDAKAAWPAWIVAVDTPSVLPSDGEAAEGPVLRAHLTVTFTAPKIGQLVSADAETAALSSCAKSARQRHWSRKSAKESCAGLGRKSSRKCRCSARRRRTKVLTGMSCWLRVRSAKPALPCCADKRRCVAVRDW